MRTYPPCTRCGCTGHMAQDHGWDPELRAADRAGLSPGDVDAVLAVLIPADFDEPEEDP